MIVTGEQVQAALATDSHVEDKVYLVFKNADMTEGRGPMVFDSAFKRFEDARDYANTHLGVMGCSPFFKNRVTGHTSTGWTDKVAWPYGGDWDVREVTLR